MTICTDHPDVQAFRQGLAQGDPPEPFVDWLQEREAPLADVVRLYAGEPPDFLSETFAEDEGLRAVLALFLRQTRGEEGFWEVMDRGTGISRHLREAPLASTPPKYPPTFHYRGIEYASHWIGLPRWQVVEARGLGREALAKEWHDAGSEQGVGRCGDPFKHCSCTYAANGILSGLFDPKAYCFLSSLALRHRRQHKRRVLSLFPDVEWKVKVSEETGRLWQVVPDEGGVDCTLIVSAPRWIPPTRDPLAYYPTFHPDGKLEINLDDD